MISNNYILLPPLVHREQTSIGEMIHVLAKGGRAAVGRSRDIRVSLRRTEVLLSLAGGQSVIISKKKPPGMPPEADGILRVTNSGQLKWALHRHLEEFVRELREFGWTGVRARIESSWTGAFQFKSEIQEATTERGDGLRPAQVGALHAIGAHWSLQKESATIIMPTGTGKTETMIAALVAFVRGGLIVIVPSRVLRDQTANKFASLGLLRKLGVLIPEARNPVVGVLRSRPESEEDLTLFRNCHVVVGTMSALGQGKAALFSRTMAEQVSTLFVDEAHHVPAESWSTFREHFKEKRTLQFTATPFRRDGKLVDGIVIYSYPLRLAQQDGYFKQISFEPVFEVDPDDGDRAIALAAVQRLREDLAAGHKHLIMARCDNIVRATRIYELYQELASEHRPILVHSEVADVEPTVNQLRSGESRIVVCVDMLSEGFDLPQLKIAALHDTHKSLAVLLQFAGRFTRTADPTVGNATVIANIANQEVSAALERLYSEDADWNHLLSEFSSLAVREHFELTNFLKNSKPLGDEVSGGALAEISQRLLLPKFSAVVYRTNQFRPKRFHEGLPTESNVHRAWLHQESNTLSFVTHTAPRLEWTKSRDLVDRRWDIFVLHYNEEQHLLYLHSSDKSSTHELLAKAVGGLDARLIYGDVVFRTLGRINRLQFQNIGVKKHGRRNLRYAMYTGADVATALGLAETAGSEKSNLFGSGWESGGPTTIGCSYKGRIWSREQGTVPEFVRWSSQIGAKLLDDTIDTRTILQNVLIPEEVEELPNSPILSVEWPIEMLQQSEDRVILSAVGQELPISMFSIQVVSPEHDRNRMEFAVTADGLQELLALELGEPNGFAVRHVGGHVLSLKIGRIAADLAAYLSDLPPLVKFVDMSELDGNLLVKPRDAQLPMFPSERFEVWDWSGVDIRKESIWKQEEERTDSIQARAASHYRGGHFDVIFDDDSPGEAADLVCLKEEEDHIRLALVHCKFTLGDSAGERIKDVVEVSSQAVRSAKWKWRFRELCRHIATREKRLRKAYRETRFLVGSAKDLNRFIAISRFKEVRAEIVVVQPGLSREGHTVDQEAVLAAALSFLKETIDIDLDVVCSE